MNTTQYYPRTLKILLADYAAGIMTIPGLIVDYIRIKFAPGWRVSLSPKKVCEELGIKLGSFYRAIALIVKKKLITRAIHLLREEKVLNEEYVGDEKSPDDKENPIHRSVKEIHKDEKNIHESVKEIHKDEKNIHIDENKIHRSVKNNPETPSETSQHSESPNLSSDSYSKFISNLSQEEREKFLEFCKKRTDSFEIPLKCGLKTFLAARNKKTDTHYFAEFWDLYKKEGDVVRGHTNENNTTGMKPNLERWYYWLNQTGRMVRKYEKNGVVYIVDNCGERRTFEEWLPNCSMEAAKKQFDAATRWGK